MGRAIWEVLEKASQIGVRQIKSPVGRVFQKYVYTYFMVKMKIKLRSFGLFWFKLGWGLCAKKDFGNFEVWGFQGQKVQI